MPPRARKTASPAPSLEESATPQTSTPEDVTPSAATDDATPAVEQESTEPEPLSPPAQAVSALIEPPAVTYRWVSASGDGSAPCRACTPAGPPAGAGSFGCGHGQWVLVADEAP